MLLCKIGGNARVYILGVGFELGRALGLGFWCRLWGVEVFYLDLGGGYHVWQGRL